MSKVTIINNTKTSIPKADYTAIKNAALGDDYKLNLIIVDGPEIQKLNTIYRNIEKPTDILSFPLSEEEGEIYICPSETEKEMIKFDRPYDNFFVFLFIHGCAHLKGHDHGDTMDKLEAELRNQFGV